MEEYHRLAISENSYSSSFDSLPCHTLYDRNYMSCLDIGAAGTFSGNSSAPAIDWEVAADAVWYKNVSRDYLSASDQNGRNLFGVTCGADGGGYTQHGDGIINSFDIGVLIFTMFGDYPYNNISDYATTITVDQRPETQSRCGNAESRADWQADLRTYDYCPSDDYSARQRRKLEVVYNNDIYNEPSMTTDALNQDDQLNMPVDTVVQGNKGTHSIDKGFVRTRHDGANGMGSWHTFEFAPTIVPIIVELILHGVWSEGQAILSNAPPPENGDEVPIWPLRHQVRWSRTSAQLAFAELGTECNPVVTGATGTQTLIGDTLSVRQEGRGSDCPFYLHLWTPIDSQKGRPGRQLEIDNKNAELVDPYKPRKLSDARVDPRTVWANRGSSAMTTLGPVVLNPSNAYELDVSHPPPSPPLPALPLPPMAPIEYSGLEVEMKLTSTNGENAQQVVDALLKQQASLNDMFREFVVNITDGASLTSVIFTHDGMNALLINAYLPNSLTDTRRLSDNDDCDDTAVVKVTITFNEYVLREIIQELKDGWPDPLKEWNVEICGDIKFTPVEGPLPEDDSGVNIALLAIILSVLGVAAMIGCAAFAYKFMKSRSRNSNYSAMDKRGPPNFETGIFIAKDSGIKNRLADWTWSIN